MAAEYESKIGIFPPQESPITPFAALSQALEDAPLSQRLTETVGESDIALVTKDDLYATILTDRAATLSANIYGKNPEEQKNLRNMFFIGALLLYHIKTYQNSVGERSHHIPRRHLQALIEGVFPIDENANPDFNTTITEHNQSMTHLILGLETDEQYTALFENKKDQLAPVFIKQQQKRKNELLEKEKSLAEFTKNPELSLLSAKEQQVFWAGISNTYYLYKVNEELNNLHALWK